MKNVFKQKIFDRCRVLVSLLLATSMIVGIIYIKVGNSDAVSCGTSKLYVLNNGLQNIQRTNLDGSSSENIITGLSSPNGVALDNNAGKMYWTDAGTNKIQRANLDGSSIEDLVTTGLNNPYAIALDTTAGKIYWTDTGTKKIQRSDLDGSNVEDLITVGINFPFGIALDITAGKMYWTDDGTDNIQRANLDGTSSGVLVTGLSTPGGIALDTAAGKMYWTDATTDNIQRADLDGSNVEELIPDLGISSPYTITLDTAAGKMYWTDGPLVKVQRANLDGSSREDIITTGLSLPYGIALDIRTSCSTGSYFNSVPKGWCLRWDRHRRAPYCDKIAPIYEAFSCTEYIGADGKNGQWFGVNGREECFGVIALADAVHESAPPNECCVCVYEGKNEKECAEYTNQITCLLNKYNCVYKVDAEGAKCIPKEKKICMHRLQSKQYTDTCTSKQAVRSGQWNTIQQELEGSCDVIRVVR